MGRLAMTFFERLSRFQLREATWTTRTWTIHSSLNRFLRTLSCHPWNYRISRSIAPGVICFRIVRISGWSREGRRNKMAAVVRTHQTLGSHTIGTGRALIRCFRCVIRCTRCSILCIRYVIRDSQWRVSIRSWNARGSCNSRDLKNRSCHWFNRGNFGSNNNIISSSNNNRIYFRNSFCNEVNIVHCNSKN